MVPVLALGIEAVGCDKELDLVFTEVDHEITMFDYNHDAKQDAICIERPTWILAYAPEEEAVLRKRYKNSFLDGAFPMTPEIRRQADMFAITKADSTRDRLKDLIVQREYELWRGRNKMIVKDSFLAKLTYP